MYSRIPSNKRAVKAWLRDYSGGLASVGIRLGLTPTQRSELEHRLLAVYPDFGTITVTKGSLRSDAAADWPMDPIRGRWLLDHLSVQSGRT